ncbi:sphingosine kinase 1-like [Zingiber officinale]|uniref:sphingosine kinase 1-like n=1 Tax=Zingiber officinale TaxID=94328 RepID=UPI001C4D9B41|nr:sphingosine kinase 1-like [Zingiber officinale]
MANDLAAPSLEEKVRIDGSVAEATLAPDGALRWSSDNGGKWCLTFDSEVLGFETEGARITIRAFVEASKGTASCGSQGGLGRRVRRDYVLDMPTDEAASLWTEKMNAYLDSLGRPKRLFIIVNPYGGKKGALRIFNTEIKPLLVDANVLYSMKETKHQLHAQEIAKTMDLLKYDGIVCVSGDGVLVEVVNGLLQREDWDSAIQVPLGIIPAGTGNGMAKSLLHSVGDLYSVSNATFSVIRGYRRPLDVVTVAQGKTKFFCVLMLTWGLVADIDIESEKYRWMGSARLDFYSLLRILKLRKYHGHIQFVPAPGYETYGEPITQSFCSSGTEFCKDDQGDTVTGSSCGYQGLAMGAYGCEWRCMNGPFIAVSINNVPWAAEDVMPAPNAKFSDGYLDAIIIRDCPKSVLLSLMLKLSDGSYCKSPYVTYFKVKGFRLEPGNRVGNPSKGGIVDSDGEVIARGDYSDCNSGKQEKEHNNLMAYGPPIEMAVDKGLATIFSPRC